MWRLVMLMQAEFNSFWVLMGKDGKGAGTNNPCASCMKVLNCLWYTYPRCIYVRRYLSSRHYAFYWSNGVSIGRMLFSAQVCYWHALAGSSKMISPSAMKWKIMQDVVESPSLHGRGGCSQMLSLWKQEIGVDRPGLLGLTSGECTVANMGN